MKRTILLAALTILAASSALAQTAAKPANEDANTPAVATPDTTNPNAPVAGANSFTEEQARQRIMNAGFSNVAGLKKDDKGVWRGKAMKAGTTSDVALDFQGNVATQ